MKNYSQKAVENFRKGYNCAQSVFLAFAEDFGIDSETALKLSSSFGGGMGRLREVCGTVSAIFLLVGYKYGYTSPTDKQAKIDHYKLIQDIARRVQQDKGSYVCRDLLQLKQGEIQSFVPDDRTAEYYQKRPCLAMVEYSAALAEQVLQNPFYFEN